MNWSRFWYDWLINLIVVVGFAWWFRIITCLCENNINILIDFFRSSKVKLLKSSFVLHILYASIHPDCFFFLPFPYGKSTNANAFPLKHIFRDSQSLWSIMVLMYNKHAKLLHPHRALNEHMIKFTSFLLYEL